MTATEIVFAVVSSSTLGGVLVLAIQWGEMRSQVKTLWNAFVKDGQRYREMQGYIDHRSPTALSKTYVEKFGDRFDPKVGLHLRAVKRFPQDDAELSRFMVKEFGTEFLLERSRVFECSFSSMIADYVALVREIERERAGAAAVS